MKKILTLLLLFAFNCAKADIPLITIEYKYTQASDTLILVSLKEDQEFCCNFLVTSSLNDTSAEFTLIRHTETGVILGTIFGRPSKSFIMETCKLQGFLDKSKVDRIAADIQSRSFRN